MVNDDDTFGWRGPMVTDVRMFQGANSLLAVRWWGGSVLNARCLQRFFNLSGPVLFASTLNVSKHASLVMGEWILT